MTDPVSAQFQAVAKQISAQYGVPVSQVMQDLATRWNQKAGFQGFGRALRGRRVSSRAYADLTDDLSAALQTTTGSGWFSGPAIALYSFGAVILGIGLFAARKKKS